MLTALLKVPLYASVDASHSSFQNYISGVYDEPDCSSSQIDHVMQVVGYGSLGGKDYWICKNSWGMCNGT
jgi:cathepsin L